MKIQILQNANRTLRVKPALLVCFVLLYNTFFWEEAFGVNLFLFSSLLLTATLLTGSSRPRPTGSTARSAG